MFHWRRHVESTSGYQIWCAVRRARSLEEQRAEWRRRQQDPPASGWFVLIGLGLASQALYWAILLGPIHALAPYVSSLVAFATFSCLVGAGPLRATYHNWYKFAFLVGAWPFWLLFIVPYSLLEFAGSLLAACEEGVGPIFTFILLLGGAVVLCLWFCGLLPRPNIP